MNANGKLDRKALPSLEIGQLQSQDYAGAAQPTGNHPGCDLGRGAEG